VTVTLLLGELLLQLN